MTTERKLCRHCQRANVNRPRGLCYACYYTPRILALYPSTSKFVPNSDARLAMWVPCPGCGDLFHLDSVALRCSTCSLPEPLRSIVSGRIRRYTAQAALNQPLIYSEVG